MRKCICLAFAVIAVAILATYIIWHENRSAVRPQGPTPSTSSFSMVVEAAQPPPLPAPLVDLRIVISKSLRTLDLYSKDIIVRTYPVGLSLDPIGPKKRQGDLRTPEGNYYICLKNPNSKYYRSLGLSYPNVQDASIARDNGVISRAEYEAVVQSQGARQCPPQGTVLGGNIVIHGRGSTADWTLGCFALDDGHMLELYTVVPVGTPVEIKP